MEHDLACGGTNEHDEDMTAKSKFLQPTKFPTIALLVLSGTDKEGKFIIVYDPTSGQPGLRLPPIPNGTQCPIDYNIVTAGQRIVAFGFRSSEVIVPVVHVYDMVTEKWRSAMPCPVRCKYLSPCSSDGVNRVFFAGGGDINGRFLPIAMQYNVDDDAWEQLPDMSEGRAFSQGVFHAGVFHVIGGYQKSLRQRTVFTTSAELYRLSSGDWSKEDKFLPSPLPTRHCIFGPDGKYYRFDFSAGKLMVKQDEIWDFVCDLPLEIQHSRHKSWYIVALKEGFCLCTAYWGEYAYMSNLLYFLSFEGEDKRTLSCKAVSLMPVKHRGTICSACACSSDD